MGLDPSQDAWAACSWGPMNTVAQDTGLKNVNQSCGSMADYWPGGRGFTLLEMLIVIAISAIVLATLVPNFAPAIARAHLITATRDIASALRLARALAISQGQDTTLEIDTREGTYRIPGKPKTYALPSDIELGLFTTSTETLDEGRGRIRFFADGSATGGRVTLNGAKTQRFIDINWLTGEIKITEPDLTGS